MRTFEFITMNIDCAGGPNPTKYQSILLFGAPGSGKGTQGKILGAIPRFFHCACGDVFRRLALESPLGNIFIEYLRQGKLVPDEPTVELWRRYIDNATHDGRFRPQTDILVLDGIPRCLRQAEMLKEALEVKAVFNLSCPQRKKLVLRIQRRALRENRLDDANVEIIQQRFKVYEEETEPLLQYYGKDVGPSRRCHPIARGSYV